MKYRNVICGALLAGIFWLLLAGCGAAEGAVPDLRTPESAPAGAFQFRNGITWGMTPEQVQQTEPTPMIERKQDLWSVLYTQSRVEVSRYAADLVFMFRENSLKMITYDFGSSAGDGSYGYLIGALSEVYGEGLTPEAGQIVALMDQIYPGFYTAERLTTPHGWIANDGTQVYLYYYADGAYAILYASPDMSAPGSGSYNTTGL